MVLCAVGLCFQFTPNLSAGDVFDQQRLSITSEQTKSEEALEKAHERELERGTRILERGTSSRRTRRQAIADLSQLNIPNSHKQYVNDFVEHITVFRRLSTIQFEADRDVYHYFVHHPDVAVSIWRAMGISQLKMQQSRERQFHVEVSDGSLGDVQLLYHSESHTLARCEGEYKSPLLLKPIQAEALIHLRPHFMLNKQGATVITHTADVFFHFPSLTFGAAAKVMSPISNAIMDHNFREVSLFLHMMTVAMVRHPGWVEQISQKMEGVHPSRHAQLMQLAAQVHFAHKKRELAAIYGEANITLEMLQSPYAHHVANPISIETDRISSGKARPVR